MPEKQTFEFPQQLRELAEKNIEQARTTYGQFMDALTQLLGSPTLTALPPRHAPKRNNRSKAIGQ